MAFETLGKFSFGEYSATLSRDDEGVFTINTKEPTVSGEDAVTLTAMSTHSDEKRARHAFCRIVTDYVFRLAAT